ncbi:MAG: hypothetical protein U0031_02605 [Thermomicrobiales bacterium]
MMTHMPVYYAGGGFPWGLLILGGIVYVLWHKGIIGGPGRHNYGPRYGGYGQGNYPPAPPMPPEPPAAPGAPGSGFGPGAGFGPGGPGFRGPREFFDEWHREAHAAEAARAQTQAQAAPPAAPMPAADATTTNPNPPIQ